MGVGCAGSGWVLATDSTLCTGRVGPRLEQAVSAKQAGKRIGRVGLIMVSLDSMVGFKDIALPNE
ncbi:MAG: hypothetical protein LUO80_00525 [Methylococcaceae bacterium]|nr:hypothetical protein [Methylococcaceae bacterium]